MTRQAVTPPAPPPHLCGTKLLAVALHMIDWFAKRLSTQVATLAGGWRRLWGRHQLLTATHKHFLLPGTRMSSAVAWRLVGGPGL